MIDVLVGGGGPVGLAAALFATRAGLQVTVVEPRDPPIDKACGEGLMPGGVRTLADLGITPGGHPLRGITYLDDEHRVSADFPDGPGLGIARTTLHACLHEACLTAGIRFVSGRVSDLDQDDRSVAAAGIRARYLLAADGLHSIVRRNLGLERPGPAHAQRRWGIRAHFEAAPWTDRVEVYWAQPCEAYVTPVGPRRVDVALLGSALDSFGDALDHFPSLRARLPPEPVDGARGAGALRQVVAHRVAGRVLLIGDAAGYLDALTGEGLALGFACAQAAVQRIAGGDVARYDADYRRITRTHRLVTGALLQAARRPALRRRLVPAAARLPSVFGILVDRLAG